MMVNKVGYGIPRVVIGEYRSFMGEEKMLRDRGVEVRVFENPECIDLMRRFLEQSPELWDEDIGE